MATLLKRKSKKTGKTLWTVQVSLDRLGKRRPTIAVGSLSKSNATTAANNIQSLATSKRAGLPIDGPVADWLSTIGDDLFAQLVKKGLLTQSRMQAESTPEPDVLTLGAFIDGYIAGRTDLKPLTQQHLIRCRNHLTGYFGEHRPLDSITPGDTDDWRRWLAAPKNEAEPRKGGQGLSENTVRRICGRAKQFFRAAVRKRLISESPFADMGDTNVRANKSREHFVTRDVAQAVIDACPDAQWKLLFALSRYGGLRCPSEHLGLRWGDVDEDRGRIVVRSPKTEHHEGKAQRVIPLFPELRPYLQAVRDELLVDFDPKQKRLSEQPIITRYRDSNANLRTQLQRIIAKAKVQPWPKLFQNLRASRATELAAEYPGHVAADWLGHSTAVAHKHYWQVTDADFERAICAAKTLQYPTETGESDGNGRNDQNEKQLDVRNSRSVYKCQATRPGLERAQQYSSFDDPAKCAAGINALGPDSGSIDPLLAEVIEAWPTLAQPLRLDIVAKVRQAQAGTSAETLERK